MKLFHWTTVLFHLTTQLAMLSVLFLFFLPEHPITHLKGLGNYHSATPNKMEMKVPPLCEKRLKYLNYFLPCFNTACYLSAAGELGSWPGMICIWWMSYFYLMNNAWHSTPTTSIL